MHDYKDYIENYPTCTYSDNDRSFKSPTDITQKYIYTLRATGKN